MNDKINCHLRYRIYNPNIIFNETINHRPLEYHQNHYNNMLNRDRVIKNYKR